ncbi:hypothetical protein IAG41_08930 [Sphingomonas sp. JC676]|uniref:hypothetical protein n=1 Tax=Sphingomonas sp. JC676 TaxID=2768065 RepID=UPI001657B7CD|nr:hypothetical protein [Sphingomonas sp. JC676]MBC9032513.1 hypothetical protein [Sphingomonas sp. JC676]
MAVIRPDRLALVAAGALAIGFPVALLPAWHAVPVKKQTPRPVPVAAEAAPPPLAAIYERPLFGNAVVEAGEAPADAPQLAGIVGRLGGDAVALVRTSDGTTRALRIGESVDGWQLVSLAIDAAFFARGTQRVRVPLPAG